MNSNLFPKCQCCGEVPKLGLYDGIRVNGVLFCSNCNYKVINSKSEDSFYERFFLAVRKSCSSIRKYKLRYILSKHKCNQ
jgi:hypothetical protein